MYDVGTPIPNSKERSACIYFRPVQAGDQDYIKIQYGNGCSAHVCISDINKVFQRLTILFDFEMNISSIEINLLFDI